MFKKKKSEIDFEEVFLDSWLLKHKDEEVFEKLESPLEKRIFYLAIIFIFLLVGTLWFFCFKYQIVEGERYAALAEKNKFSILKFGAERGIIYDRNLKQLVYNKTTFDLIFDPSKLPKDNKEKEKILMEVSNFLEEKFTEDFPKTIKNLKPEFLIYYEVNKEHLKGFEIKENKIREYEPLLSLSHNLGYLGFSDDGNEMVGKEGVERIYNDILKEEKGEIEIERDVFGNELSRKIRHYPQSGKSLILSIDYELQKKAEESLTKILELTGSKAGSVVALDPRSGEILALVSWPSYNNNLFAKGISQNEFKKILEEPLKPLFNRAISGGYSIGSTIKPFLALAALNEKIISQNTVFFCPFELCLKNKYTGEKECFLDWKFHGYTDVKKAIAESVNPFFYLIGGGYTSSDFSDPRLPREFNGLGIEKIKKYLGFFGFGEKTEVDLAGETLGRVPDPEWKDNYFKTPILKKWYLGDTYNISIGQGYFLASPLQVAVAYQAIANGGEIFKPKIIKEIIYPDGKREKVEPEIKKEILEEGKIDEKYLEIVREGMRQAVSSPAGSSFILNDLPVSVAAKTGTAETPKPGYYHAWVSAFAPYENPEILLVITVENVFGLKVASLNIAKEIFQWYFSANK